MRKIAMLMLSVVGACSDKPATDGPLAIDGPIVVDAPIVSPRCVARSGTAVTLNEIANGLAEPLGTAAPSGDERIFAIEQGGDVRVVKSGVVSATPVVSLGNKVRAGGEQGLLGIAFHPNFASTRKFYLNYTRDPDGATVIEEFTLANGSDVADAASRVVIVISQPYSNHNAGWLEFGPDGFLYIAMGDGGGSDDPLEAAQDDTRWLGKVLRIDVDSTTGSKAYGIPADNPFASSADGPDDPRPENWHKGLRNPFRFSIDGNTIWLGDVGQSEWEEINAAANAAGINWGWDDREGAHCFEPSNGCASTGRTDPIVEHSQSDNFRSIIGGRVYRGACLPDVRGTYFYSDYAQAGLWSLRCDGATVTNHVEAMPSVGQITGIHKDGFGELIVTLHDGRLMALGVE